jgi:hypothetical protein
MSRFALYLDNENRITGATYEQYASPDLIIVDNLPEGNITDYLYFGGEYLYSPLPDNTFLKEAEAEIAKLKK